MSDIKWRNDGSGLGDADYLPDGVVMHDMVNRLPIKGAKAGQKEPRKPNISKDTVASISTAKLLYGLAEGEVYGLADGAKSIRLDGTPLVDDAGNPNFEGVTWDFRNGSNDQEYIKGFPDVSNETPINVELRSSQSWIKAFNDTQISAVRVRFKWNRLSETNGENGDVKGYKIDYAIDLQTDGGAYQTVLTTKIQDKTSAGYERTHRIDLPKAKTGWQLRVRRITPNSTSDLIQDTMMIDAVAEVIDVKLSYPNTALLGVQYNAELFSNIAKMSVRLKGKIIRVPDNYDPVARTYTGIWTGNFKDAYSNNPAWIFYDLCTQWRGGLGERLDATMIDRWSLYALGQYCDQPVSDGQGGLEPRFTCNIYLQKQEEAYTVLQNIAGIFRAMSFWTGEKIFVDADVPQDSIYTYSSANIVGGVAGIQYSGTRNRDRHTLAKVAWDNPNNDYQTEYEYIRDEKAMSKFGVKVLDLSAFGCTSQAQAQRAGLWALKTEQLETRQVTFSVGLDGAIPTVGNIISLSDEAFAGRANGGRVSTVNSTQRIIELDREVTASVGDVLIINGGSGKSERRNISNVVGNRITVTAGFTSSEPEHVWAIETADLKLMRFRVMSITENDDATYAITAIQHEPQKYDAVDFGTDVKPTEITIINPDTVDAPVAVSIESRHREVQGQTVTTLVIGWSQVKGAVAYDVEWRKDDGTWIKLPRTGNVSAEIDGVYSGNYMARVRAISAFDVQSNPTTSILTEVKGKIGLPPTVVGLTATGILFGMDLKWGFVAGSGDAAYTEIQVGSAPDVNVATLTQVSYPTNTHTVTGLQGNLSQSYRARLVDKLGFKSAWSSWVTGTTDASADKIMDLIQGQIDESALDQALRSEIGKIDTNKTLLDDVAIDVSKAKADIVDAISKADAAKADAAANKIDLVAVNEAVANNKTAVDASITTLTNKDISLTNLYTALNSEYTTNKASVVQDLKTLSDKDISLTNLLTALDSDYKGNKASVAQSLTTLTNEDLALASSIDSLTSEYGSNKTSVTQSLSTLTTKTNALVTADTVIRAEISSSDNLLRNSSMTSLNGWVGDGAVISIASDVYIKVAYAGRTTSGFKTTEYYTLSKGIYTLSGTFSSNAENPIKLYLTQAGKTTFTSQDLIMSGNATRREYTFEVPEDYDKCIIGFLAYNYDSNRVTYYGNLKLEKGRMATPWTPSSIDGYSAIQETKTVVAGLAAQYTLKLDVGGRISGFGLASSATQSEFAINADRFWIAPPTGSSKGKSPFMVLSSPQTINGTVVPAGTYIDSTFIHKAAIDTAQVKDAAIKSAQIDNLAVTTAKIGLAQVDTLQIKGQAVSITAAIERTTPKDAQGRSTLAHYAYQSGNDERLISKATLDTTGAGVVFEVYLSNFKALSASGLMYLRFYADNVLKESIRLANIDSYFSTTSYKILVEGKDGNAVYEVRADAGALSRIEADSSIVILTSLKR